MATITGELTGDELSRAEVRQSKFFAQTVEENNSRLDVNVTTFSDLLKEVKFIESLLLLAGPQQG
jgi:hypothetical protein